MQSGVQFDLVDGRGGRAVLGQQFEMLGQEVGHADRTGTAGGEDLLESGPRFHEQAFAGAGQWIRYRST